MKIIRDYVVVKVPSIFIDETRYKGLDGKAIVLNVFHQPERHTRQFGIVVSTPIYLGGFPVIQEPTSTLGTFSKHPMRFKRMSDIELSVREGDKIYFHYNCLLPDGHERLYNFLWLHSKKEMFCGKETVFHYFRIKYDLIFASVRYEKTVDSAPDFNWEWESGLKPTELPVNPVDDEPLRIETRYLHGDYAYRKVVEMVGSYMFVEPDMETWEDISVPTPETLNGRPLRDSRGQVVMKPKEQWLVTKSQPEERYLQGWIRHIGSPLIGDHQELRTGMRIHFRPYANTKITFEGKEYFRMRQRHVYAWLPETETV